jgi:hypothetical protein
MELLTETAQLNNQCLDHSVRAEYWSVIKYQPHSFRSKFCSMQTVCPNGVLVKYGASTN